MRVQRSTGEGGYKHKHASWGLGLECGAKGPLFQSHLQQTFISYLSALSPVPV